MRFKVVQSVKAKPIYGCSITCRLITDILATVSVVPYYGPDSIIQHYNVEMRGEVDTTADGAYDISNLLVKASQVAKRLEKRFKGRPITP